VIQYLAGGILVLALGALVALLRPSGPSTRLFVVFCLTTVIVNVGYWDLSGTHRFTKLFFVAWTFLPGILVHLALVFPERTSLARRWPRSVWVPYAASAALWLWLQMPMSRDSWAAGAGLVVNRLYARTQALIDRVFFRARYNAGQALVRLADAMTTTLDLDRLAALITGTIDELLHPGHVALFLANDERGAFRRVGRGDGLGADTVLATCLAGRRTPLSRETL